MATINISNGLVHSTGAYCLSAGSGGSHIMVHNDYVCVPTLCTGSTANFNDLIVSGNLTVHGTCSILNTTVCTTSAMSITNAGTGPALVVNQTGSQPVVNLLDDGSSVFYIEDGGNVGIGTTNPSANLHIFDNDNNGEVVRFGSQNGGNTTYGQLRAGSAGTAINTVCGNSGYGFSIQMDSSEKLIVLPSGDVGIGEHAPNTKLHVAGPTRSCCFMANNGSDYDKFNVYGSGSYSIGMVSAITYGALNDWAMTFRMNNDADRGFWWGDDAHSKAQGAMSLTTGGIANITCSLKIGGGVSDTSGPSSTLHVYNSIPGSTVCTQLTLETYNPDFVGACGGNGILFKNLDSNNSPNEGCILAITRNDTCFGDNDERNTSFVFRMTNGGTAQDNVIFTGDGRVGIGTTNPSSALTVAGDARLGDGNKLYLYTSNSVNYLAYNKWQVQTSTALAINNDGTGGFQIQDSGSPVIFVGTDATYGGRVGINTVTPGAMFSVCNGEISLGSSSSYTTHFNYQDTGTHFISMANSGCTYFRDSSGNTRVTIQGAGNVGIGTTDFSYTQVDNTPLIGSKTNNRLFVNGSLQLMSNNDAIVIGRGTATFLKDEELGFGWGGGWYMTDGTYLCVRNGKTLCNTGNACFGGSLCVGGNTCLGNGSGDYTHINDILHVAATDSGDAHFYFGEGGTGATSYGAYWNWDSGYRHSWCSQNAGTLTMLMTYVTNDTSYLCMGRALHMGNKDIHYAKEVHFNAGARFCGVDSSGIALCGGVTANLVMKPGNSTQGYFYAEGGGAIGVLDSGGSWAIRHRNDSDTQFFTNQGTLRASIGAESYFCGNVGIGTNDPVTSLHIKDSSSVIKLDRNNSSYGPAIQLGRCGSNIWTIKESYQGGNNRDLTFMDCNDYPKVTFQQSGDVGIGTSSPSAKLDVCGTGTVFSVNGTNGTLFSVEDDLSDSLMSVNDAAGLPVLEVFADSSVCAGRYSCSDFYIASGGNIGIGTTDPYSRFQVGDTEQTTQSELTIASRYDGGGPILNFRVGHPNNAYTWNAARICATDNGNYNGRLDFQTTVNNGYSGTQPTTRLRINASGDICATCDFCAYQYCGHSNIDGTGFAARFPCGIYSSGQSWMYGTTYKNNSSICDLNEVEFVDQVKFCGTGNANELVLCGANASGINLRLQTAGTTRGFLHANSSNYIGLLDAGGHWAIQHVNDNFTAFYDSNETLRASIGTVHSQFCTGLAVCHDWGSGNHLEQLTVRGSHASLALRNTLCSGSVWLLHHEGTAGELQFYGAPIGCGANSTSWTQRMNLNQGGCLWVNCLGVGNGSGGYLRQVTGDYGNIETANAPTNGWYGYSINGRAVFMHNNGSVAGLYNDVNNQWLVDGDFNGTLRMRYAGTVRLCTTTCGALISQGGGYGLEVTGSDDGKIVLSGSTNPYIRFQEGTTDKAYLQWHGSDGAFIIANQEDNRRIYINNDLCFYNGTGCCTVWHAGNICPAKTHRPYLTNTTTACLMAQIQSCGLFTDTYASAFKAPWDYAGNADLTDAGRLTELAGTSWLTWTDNCTSATRGNITALVIAPNTGGSANKVFIYNDQGSSYAPGWREVWTNTSDGSGSGLDADLLDGVQGSSFLRSDTADTFTGTLTMGTQQALVANNYGTGVYGLYSSYRYQHVWSMGTSYNLAGDGTTPSNLYGLAWSHDNTGGQTKPGLGHQLLLMMNGSTYTALGNGIWTTGRFTSNDGGGNNDFRVEAQSTSTGPLGNKEYAIFVDASAGAVGIGTSQPSYALEVNGTAFVTGTFSAGTKNFLIDHPTKENYMLRHGSLEGPENAVYVRGTTTSSSIELPEYWTGLVDEDTITATLTPRGKYLQLFLDRVEDNEIHVGGTEIGELYDYVIYGTRKDVEDLIVEFERPVGS